MPTIGNPFGPGGSEALFDMCVYVFPGCLLSKEWVCKYRYNLNIFHVRITSRRFARQGAMAAAVDANAPLIELSRDREVFQLLRTCEVRG